MQNPGQKPPASSKAPNKNLKDMDVLYTFETKIESQNIEYWCFKDQWPYKNQDHDPNPSQEPLAPTKATNQDVKDMDVICTIKIKIESKSSKYRCLKDQCLYLN